MFDWLFRSERDKLKKEILDLTVDKALLLMQLRRHEVFSPEKAQEVPKELQREPGTAPPERKRAYRHLNREEVRKAKCAIKHGYILLDVATGLGLSYSAVRQIACGHTHRMIKAANHLASFEWDALEAAKQARLKDRKQKRGMRIQQYV